MALSVTSVASSPVAPAPRPRSEDRAPWEPDALDAGRVFPGDRVTLSPAARARSEAAGTAGERPVQAERGASGTAEAQQADGASPGDVAQAADAKPGAPAKGDKKASGPGQPSLTPEQQQQVQALAVRDRQVRAHEAAHMAAGGTLAGGASYTLEAGPDGRSYAVGGEVPIRIASGRTPDETIANARQVRRAALAPADPSGQDLSVAAAAASMEAAAQAQKARDASQAYQKTSASTAGGKKPSGGEDEKKPGAGARTSARTGLGVAA